MRDVEHDRNFILLHHIRRAVTGAGFRAAVRHARESECVLVVEGSLAGVAYAVSSNAARGAMGIDWGEYRPGLHALVIANFSNEPNSFLRLDNRKRRAFLDVAMGEGIAGKSRSPLKFGAFFFDYDLDGRLDLLTCNGHLEPDIALVQPGQTHPQPPQLFWNTGLKNQRCFEDVTAKEAGSELLASGQIGQQDFHGLDAVGDRVADLVDFPHSACA